ncbi:MAG: hypothetical protein IKN04_06420 [Clostridia bacterium]|nr:hypothetical protein [Clostridia bacterium]
MKKWLEAVKGMKGGIWLLLIAACGLALLLPASSQNRTGMTEEEQRYSATLSRIAGAGEVRISIAYAQTASSFGSASRQPTGAVIVAQGAGSVAVRLELLRAAEALLGLNAQEVEVFAMEASP